MLTRGGNRLIKKDEAYLAGEFHKQIFPEASQDGIFRTGQGSIEVGRR
jgi:hypothetical protein